jgi:signal transduction histidine kinase
MLFTAALAAGLFVLAAIAVETDSELRRESLEGEMERRVAASSRLLYYSAGGALRLDGVKDDDATTGTPEVLVLRGTGPRPELIFESRGPHLPLRGADLAAISRRAVAAETTERARVEDRRGEPVLLVAAPFYHDETELPAGAVVSAASLVANDDAHRELIVSIAIGCGVLLVLAAAAGYLLAGRSLRPAERSLAEQEEFLADAAHELRTPLASIRATLEAADIDPSLRPRAVESARRVSERMGETVEALLTRARLRAGTDAPEPVALRLDQLVEEVSGEAVANGEALLRTEPSVVRGDPRLLRIAVRNLLDNALRHGRPSANSPPVEVSVGRGIVEVADRGPGLPAGGVEEIHRFTATGSGGTGLGLSIAARIANESGGSLEVDERRSGGALLRLLLPEDQQRR